jgi:predicted transcriptional regulator
MSFIKKVLAENSKGQIKINSTSLEDPKLSLKAKGIFAWILANKLENIDVEELISASKNGRDSVYAGLRELIKQGYLLREQIRDSEGKICGVQYYVYPSGRKFVDGFIKIEEEPNNI